MADADGGSRVAAQGSNRLLPNTDPDQLKVRRAFQAWPLAWPWWAVLEWAGDFFMASGNVHRRLCFRILTMTCCKWSARIRWCLSPSAAIVTQLVTRSPESSWSWWEPGAVGGDHLLRRVPGRLADLGTCLVTWQDDTQGCASLACFARCYIARFRPAQTKIIGWSPRCERPAHDH